MGSMMQQVERELQYKCGSVSDSGMGSSAVDGGQQAKHQQHRIQLQDLVVHGVDAFLKYTFLEHTPC